MAGGACLDVPQWGGSHTLHYITEVVVEQSGDELDIPKSSTGTRPISIAVTAGPKDASTGLKSEDFHLKVDDSTVDDDGEPVVSSTTTFHVTSDELPQSKVRYNNTKS